MGQGALSKPVVQWWLSLNSSTPTQSELTGNELLVVASRRRRCGCRSSVGDALGGENRCLALAAEGRHLRHNYSGRLPSHL